MKKSVVRRGFTLIELLVVMTIIGILVGLTLPAVNVARESARRMVCVNNLTQISRAFTSHVIAQGFFPTGGWSDNWIGEPDCGYGSQQPGSWLFSILDYMEQGNIRNQGLGLDGKDRADAIWERMKTPIPIINCPTRRTRNIYPTSGGDKYITQANDHSFVGLQKSETAPKTAPIQYLPTVDECIKGDYASNSGTFGNDYNDNNNDNNNDIDGYLIRDIIKDKMVNAHSYIYKDNIIIRDYPMKNLRLNGISFLFSEVTLDEVEDGVSNTYMVGEKYLNTAKYIVDNKDSTADNESAYDGADNDNQRICSDGPHRDRKNVDYPDPFGSAHAIAFNMAFCDGSVRRVNYNINTEIHENLCNRKDLKKIEDWSAISD